jgi:hypothetical protein
MNVGTWALRLTPVAATAWLIQSQLRSERKRDIVKLVYWPIVHWAAHRAMGGRNRTRHEPEKGRFTRVEVNRFLDQAWLRYDRDEPGLPWEPTVGSRMNVRLACLTNAMMRALLVQGVERDYAIELIGDVAWRIYDKWATIPGFITRLLSRDPAERLRNNVNIFLRFPFNPPGYVFERLPGRDHIGVDMRRCPVADYFRTHDAADLCAGSWCNLDYALAEKWGGKFVRTRTLVRGDDRCDFRFLPTTGEHV